MITVTFRTLRKHIPDWVDPWNDPEIGNGPDPDYADDKWACLYDDGSVYFADEDGRSTGAPVETWANDPLGDIARECRKLYRRRANR